MDFPLDRKLPFPIAEGAERTLGKALSENPHSVNIPGRKNITDFTGGLQLAQGCRSTEMKVEHALLVAATGTIPKQANSSEGLSLGYTPVPNLPSNLLFPYPLQGI